MTMKDGERQVAPTLDGIRRDHVARYEFAAAMLKGKRVIDFACGVGYGAKILAGTAKRVLAYDIDREALAYGCQNYRHARLSFAVGDASKPGKLPPADAAVCFETIEHLEDPRALLLALRASCDWLLASVPNESAFPWAGHAHHFRHYTRAEFVELLSSCGWRVTEWNGQAGPESEVERDVDGRTLVAVAKRAPIPKRAAPRAQTAAVPPPAHVAIVGLGPSAEQFMNIVKRLGGRHRFCDEVWTINALGDVLACDRVFHMDDVRIQEIRAKALPEGNIAAMVAWLKRHPGPIITSRAHPAYPGLVEFPLEAVINSTGFAYFNSTAAYAVAYAVHLGVKKVSLFGMDFTYPNAHDAEKGRACVEFWLGMAAARGIKISIPKQSTLMDALGSQEDRLYGYDTVTPKLAASRGGRVRVRFEPCGELPPAEELEARYDHSAHPNQLVSSEP